MILNNIILIIVLLILANYLSKGTIITIVLKYIEILKNIIFIKEDDKTCKFDYNKEDIHEDESGNEENESENQEDTENTLKLNTLNISESLSISDINYSNL